jgi:hypothetical protein
MSLFVKDPTSNRQLSVNLISVRNWHYGFPLVDQSITIHIVKNPIEV